LSIRFSAALHPDVIDVIKHRSSTAGLDTIDATVIELGRQIWRDHKVTSDLLAKALLGTHKLVDLVLLMGNYAARRRCSPPSGAKPGPSLIAFHPADWKSRRYG
jgi:hypothetical protein